LLLHKKKITDDLNALKSDFQGGAYFKSGKDAADVIDLAIGKVKKTEANLKMPVQALPSS